MSNLANQLVVAEREDVARSIKALLRRPLITERSDPDTFDVVRRRREPLTKWFDYHCGWPLIVEPRLGYARLLKVGHTTDASRPARRPRVGEAPFDRRRYTLLCVVTAELLSVPVITIGLLADRVVRATSTDRALPAFDPASRTERMAYVDALRLLESYGALEVVDGSTESYVDAGDAKVLYRVDATLLMRLPAAPNSPSRLAVPAEEVPYRFEELLGELARERRYGDMTGDPPAGLEAGAGAGDPPACPEAGTGDPPAVSDPRRNLWLRHSVLRRLFDDPVLYREDLSDGELAYLTSPTGRQVMRRAAEQAGFVLEERAEGLLLVDPDALATDGMFPDDSGAAKVAALLLLDPIAASPGGSTPEQLHAEVRELLSRFPRWAKAYASHEGVARLVADAVSVLCDFGLARRAGGRVTARPAAARYRVTDATMPSVPDVSPDASVPDASVPATSVPAASVPDASGPDTFGSDASGSDTPEGNPG
ncbi:TIGR02678 family protein [Streptomyces sp. 8N706]|uniref:TIGR02678 family protein n=1 Tax=Streptomyces sp. 8N706 TaxID=3457416 RepID=UPI003FD5C610